MKSRPQSQRGAALLVAMVILTLVSTMAAGMVWQQWRAVEVETAERARVQAGWILTGALDWGRLVLREDRGNGTDHLGEAWATPLAEARLSTFLSQDRNNTDQGPEAFLSGSIRDAQSRYNLRNLIDGNDKVVAKELAVLKQLCAAADVSADTAELIATGLQQALLGEKADGHAEGTAALKPHSLAQLAWLGVDAESIRRLQPFVDLLPSPTPVNANTASREVLAAVLDVEMGSAERLVQARQKNPFKTTDEVRTQIGSKSTIDPQRLGVNSGFFEISGRLRLEGRVIEERSLVQRVGNSIEPRSRERYSVLSTSAGS